MSARELRRLTFPECAAAGLYSASVGGVPGLYGSHLVAAFEVEAGGVEPVRFVSQGEEELAALRHAAGFALTRRWRRTDGG